MALSLAVGLSLREYPWNFLFVLGLLFALRDLRSGGFAAFGFLLGSIFSPTLPSQTVPQRTAVDSEAVVVSVPRLLPDRLVCEVEVSGHRLSLNVPPSADLSYGDRVRVKGLVRPLREGTEGYYFTHGIVGRLQASVIVPIQNGPTIFRWARGVRQRFVDFSHRSLPESAASMADALCFNVTGGLDPETRDLLQQTGTVHIVSASGLHVLIVAAALEFLLGFLPVPRPFRLLALGGVLVFYACATGLQPAIVRSVLMAMVGLSAYLWQRESDLLSSLALAAIVCLLWTPSAIYDIGFQFSFVTVAAFAFFGSVRTPEPTVLGKLKKELATGLLAFLATIPLVAFYFGFVSAVSIPANLLIAPAAGLVVVISLGAFGLSLVWPAGAEAIMAGVVEPVVHFVGYVIHLLGDLSPAIQTGVSFSGYFVALFYLLALGLVRQRVRPA